MLLFVLHAKFFSVAEQDYRKVPFQRNRIMLVVIQQLYTTWSFITDVIKAIMKVK